MFGPFSPRSQPQPGHLYDVAVIGAGLAGTELAWQLAQAGKDVLLVSQALDHLGNLYHPTVAGIVFPKSSIFAQVALEIPTKLDGWAFHRYLKAEIEKTAGIHLLQSTVMGFSTSLNNLAVHTWEGPTLYAKQVILAVGAFLKARLVMGELTEEAGRLSEVAYDFLADNLIKQGFNLITNKQTVVGLESAPSYEVSFLTFSSEELHGWRLKRFNNVYAVGRCLPGEHNYKSVIESAQRLAKFLNLNSQ